MIRRGPAGLLAGLLALLALGCGNDGSSESPIMARCSGGQTMTVSDPAGDGVRAREGPRGGTLRRVRAPVPAWVDVRSVMIKVGDGVLCVSAQMAAEAPATSERLLRLLLDRELADPLAALELYDGRAGSGGEPIEGSTATASNDGRVVEAAVPFFSERNPTPAQQTGIYLENPRSFIWYLEAFDRAPSTESYLDCAPGDQAVARFPDGARIAEFPDPEGVVAACR